MRAPLTLAYVMERTIQAGDCLLWTGATQSKGYGEVWVSGRVTLAHRYVWEEINGRKLRSGEVVAHSCDCPRCLNPKHLRACSQSENLREMVSRGRDRQSVRTHCPRGHPYSGENLRVGIGRNGRPIRRCIACQKMWNAKRSE